MKTLILILFLINLYASSLYSQLVPDFRVNDDSTSFSQTRAKVDTDVKGNFVIVWMDGRLGNNSANIFAQIYNSSAIPQGTNFRVNDIPDTSSFPSVAVRDDGSFAVCWKSFGVRMKIYDKFGIPISPEIIINDSNQFIAGTPIVETDVKGKFVVAWEYFESKIYFQRLDAFGNKIGGNMKVTDYPYNHTQHDPAITVRSNGSFIITWIDTRPPILPVGNNVFMQMFDSSGIPIGVNSIVNDSAAWDDQYFYPVISSDPITGKFIVGFTYTNVHQNYSYTRYQRYNRDGIKLGNNTGITVPFESGINGISINSEGKAVIIYSINFIPMLQRIDSSGQNIGGSYIVTQMGFQTPIYFSGIKLSNDKIISVWSDQRNENFDVYCNIRSFTNPDSTVGITQISTGVPDEYVLYQNYPNPFNPETVIRYQLPVVSDVRLSVYDMLGKEVTVLVNEKQRPGTYEVTLNRKDLSSGIYFYSLITENKILSKKMIIIK